jgi:transcriptional regulator with XRE-family HTH domain
MARERGTTTSERETERQALGRFLRARREAIAPQQIGISSPRRRRTPGLRREEVAFLADIGVKWYARLEAGDEIHPSEATLTSIAAALKLSTAELDYMLALAGLRSRYLSDDESPSAVPEPFLALLRSCGSVGATIGDRILTPLRWNALADVLYGHSRYKDPIERNALVRSLFDDDFVTFLGAAREALVRRAVGMFRLNYSSQSPSPFADAVYERVKGHPLFQRLWQERIVAGELTHEEVGFRHHPVLGSLTVYAVDFTSPMCRDLFMRILVPADEATVAKFARLEALAVESPLRAHTRLASCN